MANLFAKKSMDVLTAEASATGVGNAEAVRSAHSN